MKNSVARSDHILHHSKTLSFALLLSNQKSFDSSSMFEIDQQTVAYELHAYRVLWIWRTCSSRLLCYPVSPANTRAKHLHRNACVFDSFAMPWAQLKLSFALFQFSIFSYCSRRLLRSIFCSADVRFSQCIAYNWIAISIVTNATLVATAKKNASKQIH